LNIAASPGRWSRRQSVPRTHDTSNIAKLQYHRGTFPMDLVVIAVYIGAMIGIGFYAKGPRQERI
jgi:hypothetical protein